MNLLPAHVSEAMKAQSVKSANALAKMSGTDVRKVRRLLNGDGSLKLNDAAAIILPLGLDLGGIYNG